MRERRKAGVSLRLLGQIKRTGLCNSDNSLTFTFYTLMHSNRLVDPSMAPFHRHTQIHMYAPVPGCLGESFHTVKPQTPGRLYKLTSLSRSR